MFHIALIIPLGPLPIRWLVQRHNAYRAWIEMLHEALDGSSFARRVASFKQNERSSHLKLRPISVRFEKLHLQEVFLLLVGLALHFGLVGVDTMLENPPDFAWIVAHFIDGRALLLFFLRGVGGGWRC